MTTKRLLGAVLAALSVVAAVDVSFAQTTTDAVAATESTARPDRRAGGMDRMLDGLNLSDAQRTEITALMQKHRDATQTLREQMRSAEGREGMSSVREQMRTAQQKLVDDIGVVLTPEQRQQFESMQAQRREQMRNRGGREGRGEGRGEGMRRERR